MALRTAKLFSGAHGGAGQVVEFVVPIGQTWILKDVRITNTGVAADTVNAQARSAGTWLVDLIDTQTIASLATLSWSGFFVMTAGDDLRMYDQNDTCNLWVSGTKLFGIA